MKKPKERKGNRETKQRHHNLQLMYKVVSELVGYALVPLFGPLHRLGGNRTKATWQLCRLVRDVQPFRYRLQGSVEIVLISKQFHMSRQ